MSILSPATQPQAILFDWDNTLVDTADLIYDSMNHVLISFDLPPWSREEAKRRIQFSAREGLPTLFGDRWEEALNRYRTYYYAQHLISLKPLQGAVSLLETLRHHKIPLGIVSNKTGSAVRKEVDHLKWTSYFSSVLGSGDAVNDKPSPDMAIMALAQMNIQPSQQVWFVGDAPTDWACADATGCYAIPFGDFHEHGEHAFKYDRGVKECAELERMIKTISRSNHS